MKFLLKLVGGLALLVLLAVAVAFFLPKTYRVERSAVINARPEVIYTQVGDLRAWKNWTAWHERDPEMKLSYSENSAGVGAWSAWESKSEGNGKMTFTKVEPQKQVVYQLEFPDFGMISSGTMAIAPDGAAQRVTWVSEGNLGMNPVNRWFGLFLDRMIGADFERGLAKLKPVSEAAAK